MQSKTNFLLKMLHIVSWILFIGLCIEAGGYLVNGFMVLFVNSNIAQNFWGKVNLGDLYHFNVSYFIMLVCIIIITAVLKAILFYRIVKLFHDKKINLSQPFNTSMGRSIFNMSYLTLGIGMFSYIGAKYVAGFSNQGIKLPELQSLKLAGSDVWLFMGFTLLVFANIFKKGIEIQNENQLTV